VIEPALKTLRDVFGTELTGPAWRSVVRQLIVQGYLRSDQRRYGAAVIASALA
jgi:hypothetical protein